MAPPASMPAELTEEARRIFFTIDCFLRSTSTRKPSSALESFPPSFDATSWRQVFMAVATHSAAYLTMEPWDPRDLWADGARGMFWFFTELPRIGEKVSRKTVDGGQTWSGRSGRGYRNGFPVGIRVANFVIKGTPYQMLELTLDREKPFIAICKIWMTATASSESPQTMSKGASTPDQVKDNDLEGATEMQIDQPRGQLEGIERQLHMPNSAMSMSDYTMGPDYTKEYLMYDLITMQHESTEQQLHIPHHVLSTSNYTSHPSSTGGYFNFDLLIEQFEGQQFEGSIEQELHMPDQAVSTGDHMVHPNSMGGQSLVGITQQDKMPDDAQLLCDYVVVPDFTEGSIESTGHDDNSIYQVAVSYLYQEKDSFKNIVMYGRNEAHEIAYKAQSLASAVRNLINGFAFLGINKEPENTGPSTTNNNQQRATNHVTEQAMREDEYTEQEVSQHVEGYSIDNDHFRLDEFMNFEEGAGANSGDHQDM